MTRGSRSVSTLAIFVGLLVPLSTARAQRIPPGELIVEARSAPSAVRSLIRSEQHRFWDKRNLALFVGVGTVRMLDFTSTGYARARGANELFLTNKIVDNKPLFWGIQAAGTAASVGVSYWFHRTGHHQLERWVSIIHVSVSSFGVAHNYGTPGLPFR